MNTIIPFYQQIPIAALAGVFNDTTNSYKYYWLLAILRKIADNPQQTIFKIDELVWQMIAEVWYPIHYYHLSFGKQDQLGTVVMQLSDILQLPAHAPKSEIISKTAVFVQQNPQHPVAKNIKERAKYVPFRFLTSWFTDELRAIKVDSLKNQTIVQLAEVHQQECLYYFVEQQTAIQLSSVWLAYLHQHWSIIEGFCYWHLNKYLQKNNPNVPNIPDKLQTPQQRKLSKATNFWKLVMQHNKDVKCIYSGQMLNDISISIDHFLPWSFVTHDLLWNLLPVPKNVNSSKNDAIPALETYFEDFAQLQYNAVHCIGNLQKDNWLEDYSTIFKADIEFILHLPYEVFRLHLYETIAPMAQIAANMGFSKNWRYVS